MKLKLASVTDDKPVKVTIELTAAVHQDLVVYAKLLAEAAGVAPTAPEKLIAPMVARFMATDRGFAKARRES